MPQSKLPVLSSESIDFGAVNLPMGLSLKEVDEVPDFH